MVSLTSEKRIMQKKSVSVVIGMQNKVKKSPSDSGIKELIRLKLMKYTRTRKLLCRKGYFLEIRPNGEINSTKDRSSPYAILDVISISANMIAMWGREAQMYIAVSDKGQVYTTNQEGRDCVFFEQFSHDFFNTYESYHTVNESSSHFYLTFKSTDSKVDICNNISEQCSFYWELPKIATFTKRLLQYDLNNNTIPPEGEYYI